MKIYSSKFIPQRSGTRCLIRCVSRPSWNVLCRSCRSHQSCNNECALTKNRGYFLINLWFHLGTYRCRCMSIQQSEKPAVWDVELSQKDLNGGGKIHIYKSSPMWFCMVSLRTLFWLFMFFWGASASPKRNPLSKKDYQFWKFAYAQYPPDNPIQSLVDGWWWGSACISSRSSNMTWRCDGGDKEDNIQIPIERAFCLKRVPSQKRILPIFLCQLSRNEYYDLMIECWSERGFVLRFSYGKYPVDTSTEGLQLVVREEELEQSTGEHSPGVSLPGNSGLLSTFQDIRCFYHWNCSLDELEKWCGNCRNDSSSLWVLYLCCDRNKDPNYIIAVVNVLEDRKICLSGASTRNCSKFLTFKNITFRCLKCTFLCFFWGKIISRSNLLRVAVQSVSSMNWFRPHRTRCFCPAITWHEREKWQHRSLARDETGWMGVMGPMSETSISWWGYRIPVRIMNHDNYHDHVWSIWMLQNFHGRCFGVLNILGSLWIKSQNKEHWLSNV